MHRLFCVVEAAILLEQVLHYCHCVTIERLGQFQWANVGATFRHRGEDSAQFGDAKALRADALHNHLQIGRPMKCHAYELSLSGFSMFTDRAPSFTTAYVRNVLLSILATIRWSHWRGFGNRSPYTTTCCWLLELTKEHFA